jgi:hypothetical protein
MKTFLPLPVFCWIVVRSSGVAWRQYFLSDIPHDQAILQNEFGLAAVLIGELVRSPV